jgi:predicted peptidase
MKQHVPDRVIYFSNTMFKRLSKVFICIMGLVAFCGFKPYGTNDLASLTVPQKYIAGTDGRYINYRIYVPDIPKSATNGVPLVLYLHGSGECGTDNRSQMNMGMGGLVWWSRNREPAIVIAPQSPPRTVWSPLFFNILQARMSFSTPPMIKLVKSLVDDICERYPVDTNRILATGVSLGGYGVWDLISRYPGYFAAAIPVCGAGDPQQAESVAKTSLWIFHGENDKNVQNKMDRAMVSRLWELDAPVRYMEYPDSGHAIWGRVYSDDAVMKWFFSRHRLK